MKTLFSKILILAMLLGCTSKQTEEKSNETATIKNPPAPITDTSTVVKHKTEEKDLAKPMTHGLKNFTKSDVAKYTIASIMGQSPSIIKTRKDGENYIVFYSRPSDGQKFSYKIKFENENKVIWGNSDGRWRDSSYDEKITYAEDNGKLTVIQTFEDGSSTKDVYTK